MARPPPFSREQLESAATPLSSRRRAVRFQDVDAAGTVFYPRILEYFADAYVDRLAAGGVDLPRVMRAPPWVAPLAHAEADFLGPMRFGDELLVEIVATHLGRTSFSVGYRARSADGERVLAVGHTTHVVVDAVTFRPIPVPDDVRAALSP